MKKRYTAWGAVRNADGVTPTPYTFTGQYSHMAQFGLMFFNARWLDPALGRFAQADTVIPEVTQGVQAWDRYAFVNNNPVRYNDPTGHDVGCPGEDDFAKCKSFLPIEPDNTPTPTTYPPTPTPSPKTTSTPTASPSPSSSPTSSATPISSATMKPTVIPAPSRTPTPFQITPTPGNTPEGYTPEEILEGGLNFFARTFNVFEVDPALASTPWLEPSNVVLETARAIGDPMIIGIAVFLVGTGTAIGTAQSVARFARNELEILFTHPFYSPPIDFHPPY